MDFKVNIVIGLLILVVLIIFARLFFSSNNDTGVPEPKGNLPVEEVNYDKRPEFAEAFSNIEVNEVDFTYLILQEGDGREAQEGDFVTVEYIGALENGNVFHDTLARGVAYKFQLGRGNIPAGFTNTVNGMKEGGVRLARVPPQWGYGDRAIADLIPANSTLYFYIHLVDVSSTE